VNTKSGFSIITYTGNGSSTSQTVSHGLGKIPSFAIVKARGSATNSNWRVRHNSLAANENLLLNDTTGSFSASSTAAGGGIGTLDSASTFTLVAGPGGGGFNPTDYVNQNTITYVAYCWAEIPGFSKFGSYTGNNSADGVYVHCGFRPRWLIFKRTNSTSNWSIIDTERDRYNVAALNLKANNSGIEVTGTSTAEAYLDILSNGFKFRGNSSDINDAFNYIFAAYAEAPAQNLFGGQSNAR